MKRHSNTYRHATAGIAFTAMAMMAVIPSSACHSRPARGTGTAPLAYYGDAEGVFTLEPPPAAVGYLLPFAGTVTLPEIMLTITRKGGGAPVRTACHRTGGKNMFRFAYLIKDGAGEYDVTVYGKRSLKSLSAVGLCSFTVRSQEPMPRDFRGLHINERILDFTRSVMGSTVGRGECWDLAQEALDMNGADWNRPLDFGTPVDPAFEKVRPGDIIQFRSVRITETLDRGVIKQQVIGNPDHTAVILAIEGKNKYRLAHQNIEGKRTVIASSVDLGGMISGRYRIYRPVAGIVR